MCLSISAKENFGSRKGTGPIKDGEEFLDDTDKHYYRLKDKSNKKGDLAAAQSWSAI